MARCGSYSATKNSHGHGRWTRSGSRDPGRGSKGRLEVSEASRLNPSAREVQGGGQSSRIAEYVATVGVKDALPMLLGASLRA